MSVSSAIMLSLLTLLQLLDTLSRDLTWRDACNIARDSPSVRPETLRCRGVAH